LRLLKAEEEGREPVTEEGRELEPEEFLIGEGTEEGQRRRGAGGDGENGVS
jgi:hypothetical protein